MTENEAKKVLERDSQIQIDNGALPDGIEALTVAIQALEEVQQYHQIGTVEQCLKNKDFLDFLSDKMNPNDFELYLRIYNSSGEKQEDGEG